MFLGGSCKRKRTNGLRAPSFDLLKAMLTREPLDNARKRAFPRAG